MSNDSPLITTNPDILGGTPVFPHTRVPVNALLSNLEAGLSLNEFLENFPSVSREQATRVMECYEAALPHLDAISIIAQHVLGDTENARRWLLTPNAALNHDLPLQLLRTDAGAKQIEDVLIRIDHGIYD